MCVTFPTQTLLLSSSSVKGSAMSLSCSYTHNQAITKFCRLYLQNVSQVPFLPPPGTAASVHAAILPPGDCFFQSHNWCSCVCPCHSTQWPEWFFYLKKSHYGILPLKNGRVTSRLISIERKAKVTSVSWRDLTSLLLSWPSNPFYLTSMLQPPWPLGVPPACRECSLSGPLFWKVLLLGNLSPGDLHGSSLTYFRFLLKQDILAEIFLHQPI